MDLPDNEAHRCMGCNADFFVDLMLTIRDLIPGLTMGDEIVRQAEMVGVEVNDAFYDYFETIEEDLLIARFAIFIFIPNLPCVRFPPE